MKYLRKITVVVIIFVMLAALAVGLGVIFAVKNINVTIETYSYLSDDTTPDEDLAKYKQAFLDEYKGKLITFVSEESIEEDLISMDSNYVVTNFEKTLPCTIDITLTERKETYVYDNGDGTYNIYDSTGRLLRVAESEEDTFNTTGGQYSPNVWLDIPNINMVEEAAKLGDAFQSHFKKIFSDYSNAPIRSTVESIWIEGRVSTYTGYNVVFKLRCGIQVEIYDYNDDLDEKMEVAYQQFNKLSSEEKLMGYIYCYHNTTTNELAAAYTADRSNLISYQDEEAAEQAAN